jgi:hypothetical protein
MLSHSMTTTLFALASVRTILITKCYVIDNHSFKNEGDEITAKVFNTVPILSTVHSTNFRRGWSRK